MNRTSYYLLILLLGACWPAATATAQTPIHQCKDADGNVVYSQLPCKDEEPAQKEETPDEADAPLSQEPPLIPAESAPPEDAQEAPASAEGSAACKKRYRDAIDEIDAEIRREYTPDKDAEYKQRLLALTRALRAC